MEKLISVVVPVYNVERYLEKCIRSIINQSYKNLEVILVDDGATDHSGELCDKFASMDARIKVIHKENGGLSDARNAGIDVATGEYLAFVDSDDFIHPKMYETMVRIMEKDQAEMAICKIAHVREDDSINQNLSIPTDSKRMVSGKDLQHMYFDNRYAQMVVVAWNKIYKRGYFEEIRYPKGKIHEDEYTTYKITYPCSRISIIDAPFYYYVTRDTSIMGSFDGKRFDLLKSYIERMQYFAEHKDAEIAGCYAKRFVRMANQYQIWSQESGKDFSDMAGKCKRRFAKVYQDCEKKIKLSPKVRMEILLYLRMEKVYFKIWNLKKR